MTRRPKTAMGRRARCASSIAPQRLFLPARLRRRFLRNRRTPTEGSLRQPRWKRGHHSKPGTCDLVTRALMPPAQICAGAASNDRPSRDPFPLTAWALDQPSAPPSGTSGSARWRARVNLFCFVSRHIVCILPWFQFSLHGRPLGAPTLLLPSGAPQQVWVAQTIEHSSETLLNAAAFVLPPIS